MKTLFWRFGLLVALSLLALEGSLQAQETDWKLRVDLVDGSRLIGTTTNQAIRMDVGFDELTIPLERIRHAQSSDKGKTLRVELVNRDILTGKLIAEPLSLETLFGPVKLSMEHVVAFDVIPKQMMGWLPTEEGLVLYYPLDDGERASNQAGDKLHGKVTGVKWLEEARNGGGFEFDGNSRITVPHHEDICPEQFTLAAWICPLGETSNYQMVMAKTSAGSWSGGYGLVRNSGDARHLTFFVNSYSSYAVKAAVPHDKWSHVAGTYDGTTLTVYLNGQQVDQRKFPEGQKIQHDPNVPLTFGGAESGYEWRGKMDEIVLYNRALSAEEIQRLYEAVPAR